jgi:Arc/MetJ family transcription regulator
MGRTNVVVDDDLIERVMRQYGLRTKRAAIEFALRAVAGRSDRRAILELEGAGWAGDVKRMRQSRVQES